MQIARPLQELTSGKNTGRKREAITWNNRCKGSFDELKHLCTTASILAYANLTKPLKLHTDACGSGLGLSSTRSMTMGWMDASISYTSRSLTKARIHNPAHKLEFLTLMWAVVKKFHKYLDGLTFDIYTNNNPLTHILTTAKLDAVSHHWVASLTNFNFQLYYRMWKANIDMDVLLRMSWPLCVPETLGTHA